MQLHSRPTPSPKPTPSPAPRPTVVRARIIATPDVRIALTTNGASAHHETVRRAGSARPRPPKIRQTKPIWDLPAGGHGAGAGNNAGAGSLGNGGTGTGAGSSGNGNGAAGGTEPCGFVEFSDPNGSRYDRRTHGFWVDIRLTVHFPDGHSESTLLDYPFFYASENVNPWSDRNRNDPAFPTLFQAPPEQIRASEPAIVQYVMTHTSSEGFTLLRDCPGR